MAEEAAPKGSEHFAARRTPTSEEVKAAAYDTQKTLNLIQDYQLTAVDLAQLLERLPEKLVPW